MRDKQKKPRKFDKEVKQSVVKIYESDKSQNNFTTECQITVLSTE